MEHGLQTHTVPEAAKLRRSSRAAWASRATINLPAALKTHTTHVRNTYDRLFSKSKKQLTKDESPPYVIDKDAALANAPPRA
jgi:glutamine synthetase adenylyltransferase